MFERDIVDEEILLEMEKNLLKNAFIEDTRENDSRVKAIGLLINAAENFERSGLFKEAEAITRVAEHVATDPATKGLTSEKQVHNLETTGIPLNLPKEVATNSADDSDKEDDLYEVLMSDPDIAGKVSILIDDEDEDQKYTNEFAELAKMW